MIVIVEESKVQYWQLLDIPRPITSYCFYKDIRPSPNLYPNLRIAAVYLCSMCNRIGKFGGRDYSSDMRPSYSLYFVLQRYMFYTREEHEN